MPSYIVSFIHGSYRALQLPSYWIFVEIVSVLRYAPPIRINSKRLQSPENLPPLDLGVSQNWGYLFGGVPIIRTIVYWGLYWGSPYFGKLPFYFERQSKFVWRSPLPFVQYSGADLQLQESSTCSSQTSTLSGRITISAMCHVLMGDSLAV